MGRAPLQAVLEQYALSWLMQLPALRSAAGGEGLAPPVVGASQERMVRELAEALEALTAEQLLVLVLEDLHWSDHATLDLIAWLARRREPARLLVVGTYRPVEVIVHGHPLRAVAQELTRHRQGLELRLEGLPDAAVTAYLAARLPGHPAPADLAGVLHRRTHGYPLFMVETVDAWLRHGLVRKVEGRWAAPGGLAVLETSIPESVRQLIEQQLEGLGPEANRVLEAASVVLAPVYGWFTEGLDTADLQEANALLEELW
jgi:predicted ATPase